MLISALAALAMFAAAETAQGGASAPEAKPEMRRVCTTIHVSGSNLPKKQCRMVPVKAEPKLAQEASSETAPNAPATKAE